MARKPPAADPEFEEEELSEAEIERRRRQEARREAKRQKKELARIEKEMRGPTPRWVVVAIAAAVCLLMLGTMAAYWAWCAHSVKLQRKSFLDRYGTVDLSPIRRFAPAQLRQVEELKQAAEERGGSLSWKDRLAKYREAEDALAQAVVTARTASDAYDTALGRFRVLKAEAARQRLPEYARSLWLRIEEAEREATMDASQDFSAALATEKLRQAVLALEKVSESYMHLRTLDAAYRSFRDALVNVREEEWTRNAPDAWASLQGMVKLGESAAEATEWQKAAQVYQRAQELINPTFERLQALRTEAAQAVSVMQQGLRTAEAGGMATADPAGWRRLSAAGAEAASLLEKHDYPAATRTAQQVSAQLGEAGESVRRAVEQLGQTLVAIKTLYERATAESAFFTQNYGPQWAAAREEYPRVEEMGRGPASVELAERAAALRRSLEELLAFRDRVFQDLRQAQDRLDTMAKAPLHAYLERNFPEAYVKIADLRQTSERRRERADLRAARDLLLEAANATEALLKQMNDVRNQALTLRAALRDRRGRFQDGMRRHMGRQNAVVTQDMQRLERLVEGNLYKDALDLAKALDAVIPAERYVPQENGTVIDYEKGFMWVGDGASPDGNNGGRPLNWYDALTWVSASRFAKFDDWRLPNEEELRDLWRLPAADRNRLFPNTRIGVYWTRVPSQDVDKALAVDIGTGRISLENKQSSLTVRAVRQPNMP